MGGPRGPGEPSLLLTASLAFVLVTVPAIASVAASVPGVSEAPWGAWRTDTVDKTGFDPTAIALTPDGEPRIAYQAGADGVHVARPTTTGWTDSRVQPDGFPGGIAIATDGTEWVAHSDDGNVYTSYREGPPDEWTQERVDFGFEEALDLDPSQRPTLLYVTLRNDGTLDLQLAIREGPDTWDTETVQTAPSDSVIRLGDPVLAVDEQDRVHGAWINRPSNDAAWTVQYGLRDTTGSWSFAWLDQCSAQGFDIGVDAQDQPHIVCQANHHGLGHYTTTSSGWTFETAADGSDVTPPRADGAVGFEPSIAIGPNGGIHAVFHTGFNPFFSDDPTRPAHLYYAYQATTSSAWHTEPIDPKGTGVGWSPSVAVDGDGSPHVSYMFNWRSSTVPCFGDHHPGQPVNPCDEIRYAEPIAATATGALG